MSEVQTTRNPRRTSLLGRMARRVLFLPFRGAAKRYAPVPVGLCIANLFFQRVLGLNASIPWMTHYTSRVSGEITIGKNVWKSFAVSAGCYIQGINGIHIGDDTIFAPNVSIISANHEAGNLQKWANADPIRIGRHCWIGAGAIILPGVQLGEHVIVGAGSVVTKSFPSHSVVAGVPARLLRTAETAS